MTRGRRWRKNRRLLRDKRRIVCVETRSKIAGLAARGLARKEIAQRLAVHVDTVHKHLNTSLKRVAEMSQEQRDGIAKVPPPATDESPRRQALELRKANHTYDDIARTLGQPESTVRRYVAEELERLDADEMNNADLARRMELERLDALMCAVWPRAMDGDTDAVGTALRVMERRSKLLGLDAPTRINIEQQLRAAARERGLDEEDAVREAYALLKAQSRA